MRASEPSGVVVVFAVGRNGSTLLTRLLDGSPGIWIYPLEVNYMGKRDGFAAAPESFVDWQRDQEARLADQYLSRLEDPITPIELPLPAEDSAPEDKLLALLRSTRTAYAPAALDEPVYLFKTLEAGAIPRYEALFPHLRQLHIFRNPLTNYESLKRTVLVHRGLPFWSYEGGDVLSTFIETWRTHALDVLDEDNGLRHIVRFEDLLSDPTNCVQRVCAHLGVGPPAEPDTQTTLGGRRLRELPRPANDTRPPRPMKPDPSYQRTAGYVEVLTRREQELIQYALGDVAARLGYDLGERPRTTSLAWRWLLPDRWELMNSGHPATALGPLARRRRYIYSRLLKDGPS
jgi:Sulfotransferase family